MAANAKEPSVRPDSADSTLREPITRVPSKIPKSWAISCRRNIILISLVAQITLSALLMRYSRTSHPRHSGPAYCASVAVFATEALKLPVCTLLAATSLGGFSSLRSFMQAELPTLSTLKCSLPAVAFTIQGNLMFVATANLEIPIFQVTYQTKTLFTAFFSVLFLSRKLVASQWGALLLLFSGAIAATDMSGTRQNSTGNQNPGLGLTAVLAAAILSAASSVYFEVKPCDAPHFSSSVLHLIINLHGHNCMSNVAYC